MVIRHQQIHVSDRERKRLEQRIEDDMMSAKMAHQARIERIRRIWRQWRGLDETVGSRQEGPDLQVPMLKSITLSQLARMLKSLLGDDAQVVAATETPSEQDDAQKVGLYMTWRVFKYMRATAALTVWIFRAILFGRAHAKMLYERQYYWERCDIAEMEAGELDKKIRESEEAGLEWFDNGDGTYDFEQLAYDGPTLQALWPSQIVTPPEDDPQCIDDFPWIIEKTRVSVGDLLEGERHGRFQGIKENWKVLNDAAADTQNRDFLHDDERWDSDEAEGVDRQAPINNRDSLSMWIWYGKWRFLKGRADGRPDNLDRRNVRESEVVICYLPDCQMVVSIQDRRTLWPKMRKRTPFLDLAPIKDGSYWGPGFGEMLYDLQNESTVNHALFRRAGQLSTGPVVFYAPASGLDPDAFEYRPNLAIPSADPKGVNVLNLRADLNFVQAMHQLLKGFSESLTGVSDTTAGLSSDRPNAPRTASGQAMLIEEGNTRASLDMLMIREDFEKMLAYAWDLDRAYADEEVFFRVADDDMPENFDSDKGFGKMTALERNTPYSFTLKFATSVWSREAMRERMLNLYQQSLANPVIATNPRALWVILNRVWASMGEKNFSQIIPEPPEPEMPKTPKLEWKAMLDGDIVEVNPADDDMAHILDHRRRLQMAMEDDPQRRDYRMEEGVMQHIVAHEQQRRQKMLLQKLATEAVAAMGQMGVPAGMPTPTSPDGLAPEMPPALARPPQPGPTGPVGPAEQMQAE